jgi:Ca-activated chloride channel family protein
LPSASDAGGFPDVAPGAVFDLGWGRGQQHHVAEIAQHGRGVCGSLPEQPARDRQVRQVDAPEELAADLAEEAEALTDLARETEVGSASRAAKYLSASSAARLRKRGRAYPTPPVSPADVPQTEHEPNPEDGTDGPTPEKR